MFIRALKKEILTIPNLLSLLRLLLIPVYITLYLRARTDREFLACGLIIALSCLTDAVDGRIARHFHMISRVGKVLDPLADKLTQFALTLCLSLKHPVLQPVLALFVVKEGLQLGFGIMYFRRGKALPGALGAGKLCTTVLFVSLTALVLFPRAPEALVSAVALVNACFLLYAFVCYFFAYFGKHALVEDL